MSTFKNVRAVILQPRLSRKPAEWDCTVEELRRWAHNVARGAAMSRQMAVKLADGSDQWRETYLRPNEKSCRFCKAKATCPALRDEVASAVFEAVPATPDEFSDQCASPDAEAHGDEFTADWLSACLSKVDLIEDWCKAVRAEAERRLLAGEAVPGFKVVQGKRGNRQWADAQAAEQLLRKVFRLPIEQAYDLKLISPTTAEKLFKAGEIGPRQWPKALELITQSEGKPHVAPESDPRPALEIRPVADDFESLA